MKTCATCSHYLNGICYNQLAFITDEEADYINATEDFSSVSHKPDDSCDRHYVEDINEYN